MCPNSDSSYRARFLFLMSPFLHSIQNRLAVGEEVARILREREKTVIMVTHDIPEAVSMANRVVVMTPALGQFKVSILLNV